MTDEILKLNYLLFSKYIKNTIEIIKSVQSNFNFELSEKLGLFAQDSINLADKFFNDILTYLTSLHYELLSSVKSDIKDFDAFVNYIKGIYYEK